MKIMQVKRLLLLLLYILKQGHWTILSSAFYLYSLVFVRQSLLSEFSKSLGVPTAIQGLEELALKDNPEIVEYFQASTTTFRLQAGFWMDYEAIQTRIRQSWPTAFNTNLKFPLFEG